MPRMLVRPDTLYAWGGPSLPVVNTHGECGGDKLCGFYHDEARFLQARSPLLMCTRKSLSWAAAARASQATRSMPTNAAFRNAR